MSDGFAAVAAGADGLTLLRLDGDGQETARFSLPAPDWAEPSTLLKIESIAAGPDGSLLLVGWSATGEGEARRQSGLVGLVDRGDRVRWAGAVRGDKARGKGRQIGIILYSAAFNPATGRFFIAGRQTNGPAGNDCSNWSQGLVLRIPAAGIDKAMSRLLVGEATPGFENRIAFYSVAPTGREGEFLAAGFATKPDESGEHCQDEAAWMLLRDTGAKDLVRGNLEVLGEPERNEGAFAALPLESGSFLLGGYGNRVGGERAALFRSTDPGAGEPGLFSFPEGADDTGGNDNYHAIAPLPDGEMLLVGSVSTARGGPARAFWRVLSPALAAGPPRFLTESSASDIRAVAAAPDGRVLGAGSHAQDDGTVGWLGFLNEAAPAGIRRVPDASLPAIGAAEIDAGTLALSPREVRNGVALYGTSLAAGQALDLAFTVSAESPFTLSALTGSGNVDLALLDADDRLLGFSASLREAAEQLSLPLAPGAYRARLVAVTAVADIEVRLGLGSPILAAAVTQSFGSLDAQQRNTLDRRLEAAGYARAGNSAIALGSDTARALLAYYSNFHEQAEGDGAIPDLGRFARDQAALVSEP